MYKPTVCVTARVPDCCRKGVGFESGPQKGYTGTRDQNFKNNIFKNFPKTHFPLFTEQNNANIVPQYYPNFQLFQIELIC